MEVFSSGGNKVLWEVVDNHVVEEKNDRDEIGLRGFDFKFFYEDEEGISREGLSEYTHLLFPKKLWTGDLNNQLKNTNMKVDEENVKGQEMANGWYQNVWRFSSNEFWKNIGCLVSDPIFGLWGSSIWKKR